MSRGGVEDTRLEAKAKNCLSEDRHSRGKDRNARGQGQGPRTQAQVLSKKKSLHKNFLSDLKKKKRKKGFTKIFQAISTKKRFPKKFSSASQNFNNSENTAVLEPRTGQFSRTWSLEARPRTSKCVLEDVLEAKDVLEDSTSANE